jgi:hypothetical protein
MIYHNIRSFGREDGKEPRHLELYFYDDDLSLEHRYRTCREEKYQKDKEVMERLVDILCDNPYSKHLRTMGQVTLGVRFFGTYANSVPHETGTDRFLKKLGTEEIQYR